MKVVASYFAVFLCGFAAWREIEQASRKDAKSQRRAKLD